MKIFLSLLTRGCSYRLHSRSYKYRPPEIHVMISLCNYLSTYFNVTLMINSQWNLQVIVIWESKGDFNVTLLGDSSQRNIHKELTAKSPNDGHLIIIMRRWKISYFSLRFSTLVNICDVTVTLPDFVVGNICYDW